MNLLGQFMALLVVHWIADFVLQTHWQASNKSKNIEALSRHVLSYTMVLLVASILIFGWTPTTFGFVALNGVLHWWTDFFTSRISSSLFAKAIADMDSHKAFALSHAGRQPTPAESFWHGFDPAKRWHDFFVMIGLDQLIHQATLAATLWIILS